MAKSAVPPTATDDEVRALLILYRCPVPFHEVRTRFLGNITSPGMGVSPIKVVERLWGVGRQVARVRDDRCGERTGRRAGHGPMEPAFASSGSECALPPHPDRDRGDARRACCPGDVAAAGALRA